MNTQKIVGTFAKRQGQARAALKNFSLVPLLVGGESISPEARQALRENRVKDAAHMIMDDYGLSCAEVGDLLNLRAC